MILRSLTDFKKIIHYRKTDATCDMAKFTFNCPIEKNF